MISVYRIGDLFVNYLDENETKDIINQHPGSIGAEYALTRRFPFDINTMTNIVKQKIQNCSNKIPKDIENSTVIHVRLGDVVAGQQYHEFRKRPLDTEYLKKIIPSNQKVYIIGKCFFAKPSSTNYDECIEESNRYLEKLISETGAFHFDGGNPDIDLCCAVCSKLFIQGRGYFSSLITQVRKNLNLQCIETLAET
jgi:hypothetical protein